MRINQSGEVRKEKDGIGLDRIGKGKGSKVREREWKRRGVLKEMRSL